MTGLRVAALAAGVALAAVLAAGCGRKHPTDEQFGLPDTSAQAAAAREQALLDGVAAMTAFQREQVRASVEKSAPNYGPARASLSGAIARLRPAPGKIPAPQLEACIPPLESALAAMDQVIAAGKAGDPVAAGEGWTIFNLSTEALLLVLPPPPAAADTPAR
ncbi:MAG TPA: hypothetical protein PK280_13150 [Planctomycetota bacterium]|nr:hypothetical protein [Planctomycetota bacterium]